jgi:DNA-binding MarR family transcriptional regulator
MGQDNEQVIKNTVAALRRLLRAVYIDNAKMSRQYGVTGAQGSVMRSLRDSGPASSAQLSRILYVKPSTMTGIIDRLEKKGLVVRTPKIGDRRVSIIMMTPEGEVLTRQLPDPLEMKLVSNLSDLDTEHVKQVSTIVEELLSMIEVTNIETPTFDTLMEQTSNNKSLHNHLDK